MDGTSWRVEKSFHSLITFRMRLEYDAMLCVKILQFSDDVMIT